MFPFLAFRFLFLLIGLLLVAVGAFSTWSTKSFVDHSVTTEGTVIGFDRSLSTDDGDTLVRPVVAFMAKDGSSFEFTSAFGSGKPRQSEGDTVTVLYRADEPGDAEIRDFWTLWFGPIVLGGLGTVFTTIGVAVFLGLRPDRPRRAAEDRAPEGCAPEGCAPRDKTASTTSRDPGHLREDGLPIRATVTGVVTSAASASEPWWKLVAEWTDPTLQERREFMSHRLPADPLPNVVDDEVLVFVDPENDEHFLIDLSFLDGAPTIPDGSVDAHDG